MLPTQSRRVSRHPAMLAGSRDAVVLLRQFTGERVENPTLNRELIVVREIETMLELNLRRPYPDISGRGQRRISGRCKRRGRARGEKRHILSRAAARVRG